MTKIQYFTAPGGHEMAIVARDELERLRDLAEARDDAAAAAAVDRRIADGEEDVLPHGMVVRLVAGENRLKVWREHRGMTIAGLAMEAGLSRAQVSQMESGARAGSIVSYLRLARVLGVETGDILPSEEQLAEMNPAPAGKAATPV